MLTADLVDVRRRAGELSIVRLTPDRVALAVRLGEETLRLAQAFVGRTRGEFDSALKAVHAPANELKLKKAMRKLVEDRCDFDEVDGGEVELVRRAVFLRAAEMRRALAEGEPLDRSSVLDDVARERGLSPESLETRLFADLRSAQKLRGVAAVEPARLASDLDLFQAQAILLRAVTLTVDVESSRPAAYRRLFRALKFHQLLFRLEEEQGKYRIVLDGPFSLFESVTKYGLALALVLPAIVACDVWNIQAMVRWVAAGGKAKGTYVFRWNGVARGSCPEVGEHPFARSFVDQLKGLGTSWRAEPNERLIPTREGVLIPDLCVIHEETGKKIYVEFLGFWSRDAVWKRVELVESGIDVPIVFAVSANLRVSPDVLPEELPAALYVFKSAVRPRQLLERIEQVSARDSCAQEQRTRVAPDRSSQ